MQIGLLQKISLSQLNFSTSESSYGVSLELELLCGIAIICARNLEIICPIGSVEFNYKLILYLIVIESLCEIAKCEKLIFVDIDSYRIDYTVSTPKFDPLEHFLYLRLSIFTKSWKFYMVYTVYRDFRITLCTYLYIMVALFFFQNVFTFRI